MNESGEKRVQVDVFAEAQKRKERLISARALQEAGLYIAPTGLLVGLIEKNFEGINIGAGVGFALAGFALGAASYVLKKKA